MPHKLNIDEVGRYNPSNLPPNPEVALARIDQLEIDLERVYAQMHHWNPDEWDSYEDYLGWKERIVAYIAYTRVERGFLLRWLKQFAKIHKDSPIRQLILDQLKLRPWDFEYLAVSRQALEHISAKVDGLMETMEDRYTQVYTFQNPPLSLEEAESRHAAIRPLPDYFLGLFRELEDEAKLIGVQRVCLSQLNQPLRDIDVQMRAESGLLKRYIGAKKHTQRQDEIKFLLGLVERGTNSTTILTEEEAALIQTIREHTAKES